MAETKKTVEKDAFPLWHVGMPVLYRLSASDVKSITKRRADAAQNLGIHRENQNGVVLHVGEHVAEGDQCFMIITATEIDGCVNGQVTLDGNDTLWVTSAEYGDDPGTFSHIDN